MINLGKKVSLDNIGEIEFEGGRVNRIRTTLNQLNVSTARLPGGEYETMILDYSGKRVDIIMGRKPDLTGALQSHFDHMHLLMSLAQRMPLSPDAELRHSGELEKNYAGQWVAIMDGKVLAHDESLGEIAGREYDEGRRNPTFYFVPIQEDNCFLKL